MGPSGTVRSVVPVRYGIISMRLEIALLLIMIMIMIIMMLMMTKESLYNINSHLNSYCSGNLALKL
jgi:hypothetical protein